VEIGIFQNFEYLHKFFGNLLLGENNVLNSCDMRLPMAQTEAITDKRNGITDKISKITNKLKEKELDFFAEIFDFLADGAEITNVQAQKISQKSAESVKKYFAALVNAGVLIAIGERKARKYKLNTRGKIEE